MSKSEIFAGAVCMRKKESKYVLETYRHYSLLFASRRGQNIENNCKASLDCYCSVECSPKSLT